MGIFPGLGGIVPEAKAVSGTLTVANIGLGNSNGTWSASGSSINGSVSYGTTSTLTITNTSSYKGRLTFNYTLTLKSGYNSTSTANVAGNPYSRKCNGALLSESQTWDNQSAAVDLGAGASTTITITAASGNRLGRGSGTIAITNIDLALEIPVATTFQPAAKGGSYTVNGTAITSEKQISSTVMAGFAVKATPASGFVFAGWSWVASDGSGGTLSVDADTTIYPKEGYTVKPVFISQSLGEPFQVGNSK